MATPEGAQSVQGIKNLENRTEWEFGCCATKSWHDRRDQIRVFGVQYIWETDKKPTIEMFNGSEESGHWWSRLTPSAARELAAALVSAANFHDNFKPGIDTTPTNPPNEPKEPRQ